MTTFPARRAPGFPGFPVFAAILAASALLALAGCGTTAPTPPPPPPAETPASAPRAAISLRVGSLDLSSWRGRIERRQVDELAGLISALKLDVVAIQGITRYPGVSSRLDLVDALGAATGMRTSFGETIAVSGRQSGNAVLSSYPIASSDSKNYQGVSGTGFEGALQAIVDAGTRTIVFVSTRLPEPLAGKDLRICTGTLFGIAREYPDDPVVVLGNLPPPPAGDTWNTAGADPAGVEMSWFTPRGITMRGADGARCALGDVRVADVDIFPRGRP
jgi:endonuclease/exonuclease/phosphatase family metal-dependent hydrolase